MTRREFFLGGAAAFAALPVASVAEATSESGSLITSAPVLMNPSERSVDVVFAVSGEASGWVEISKSPDMAKMVRVYSGEGAVMRVNGIDNQCRFFVFSTQIYTNLDMRTFHIMVN